MWIVTHWWNDHESAVTEFSNESEAKEHFDNVKDETSATVYLAEVKEMKL